MRLTGLSLFQYFVKVVPTSFTDSRGYSLSTNQYSVTEHVRALQPRQLNEVLPGIYIVYDISPIKVEIREEARGFWHFFTSMCGIVGGVLAIATLADSALYALTKRLAKRYGLALGKTG